MITHSISLVLLTMICQVMCLVQGNYSTELDVRVTLETFIEQLSQSNFEGEEEMNNFTLFEMSEFADPPSNLNVNIIASKSNRRSLRKLDAFIRWNATFDKRRRYYELVVIPESDECGQHFHTYHREILPTETNYTITYAPYREIRRGCIYNISLASVPPYHGYNDGHTIYAILAVDTKLIASFDVSVKMTKTFSRSSALASITWVCSSNQTSINHFRISLFKQVLSNRNETVLQKQASQVISFSNWTNKYDVTFNVTLAEKYMVLVTGFDDHQCSISANKTFSFAAVNGIADPKHHFDFIHALSIIVPLFSVTLAAYTGCLLWKRWNRQYKPATSYSIDYYSSNLTKPNGIQFGQTRFSNEPQDVIAISQHFNINYVEEEVQQARDKGIVDFYEIHCNRLTIGHEIGKGAFGRVCIARAESIAGIPGQTIVAVKFLKESSDEKERKDFLAEMTMMKTAGHHLNVVAMLGCCTLQEPFCMIMEYVSFGDLLNYLRKLRSKYEVSNTKIKVSISKDESPVTTDRKSSKQSSDGVFCVEQDQQNEPSIKINKVRLQKHDSYQNTSMSSKTTEDTIMFASNESVDVVDIQNGSSSCVQDISLDPIELQNFALQIANGMNHLAQRGIVHRDLAARNILIGDEKTLKISDFGLSRSGVYVTQSRGGRVPLRWLSLEAIRNFLYSTESDVWAYGIVLWEICTLGGFPYSSIMDKDLFGYLVNGDRLERPANCSEKLYNLMFSCWKESPHQRPSFEELCETLELMSQEPHTYVNFDIIESSQLPPMQDNDGIDVKSNHVDES